MRLQLVTWDHRAPSGGNTYNDQLCAALRGAGVEVAVRRLPGGWPAPEAPDRARLAEALDAHPLSLVDGIVAAACPAEIAAADGAGRRVVVLHHMSVADDVSLPGDVADARGAAELAALTAAWRVVCTSQHAAAGLRARGVPDVRVALPGARREPLAAGSAPPHLLCLASLTPTKNQLLLIEALAGLRHVAWRATLAGATDVDPDYAQRVRDAIVAAGLTDRVELPGVLTGPPLAQRWGGTDLLMLPSRTETFGLVVTEAVAHGVPALVAAGTGAAEALAGAGVREAARGEPEAVGALTGADIALADIPGAALPPTDAASWRDVLARWLADAQLRHRWRVAARARQELLRGWDATADDVIAHLS